MLCNIFEQVIEWNSCLYLRFVDFEKAFDSIHRETLWHFLKSYGIPTKLVDMIRATYENCRCAMFDGTGHLEWFDVISGSSKAASYQTFYLSLLLTEL